jgi:hypothetical protein
LRKRRSPAEKKSLSYAKDRRNSYGENDKSSRKNIPRKKRVPHRADRHREHQTLQGASGTLSEPLAELAEAKLLARRPKMAGGRLKWADQALGEYLQDRLRRRARLGINDLAATDTAIDRIQSRQHDRKKARP